MPLLLKYLADSYMYTTCFKNSKLLRRERLKSASLDNRHLTLLLAFLGCIRINCVKNPNGGYHTVSQKKEILKKKKMSQWTNKTIYGEIKENASSAERQKGPSSWDLC